MKKLFIIGFSLLTTAAAFVGCKPSTVDDQLAKEIQAGRTTFTQQIAMYASNYGGTATVGNTIAIKLASENVVLNFDGSVFSGYSGTGYAFDIVLFSDTADYVASGTYVADTSETYEPFTFDPATTYLNIIQGGAVTATYFKDLKIVVENNGDKISIDGVTNAGATVKASFSGKCPVENFYTLLEPQTAYEYDLTINKAEYEAYEYNRTDWATDSSYSYWTEYYAYAAEFYQGYADMFYATGDSTMGDMYAYYADQFNDAAQEYAFYKGYYTPYNTHYFTLTTEAGDQLALEIDLYRLDTVYTEVIPSGEYTTEIYSGSHWKGSGFATSTIWTKVQETGSYFITADNTVYYILGGKAKVEMNGSKVKSISGEVTTVYGTKIKFAL